jgi:uncharacterized protein YecE (DUF72 family)
MPSEKMSSLDPDRFYFRGLHPNVFMGTASDRYSGWTGQIYSPERYEGRMTTRKRRLGGKDYISQVFPVDSVQEYFEHFPTLEIDYTFYSPLLDDEGKPARSYALIEKYQKHLGEKDTLILKAPQIIFARKLWRKGRFVENPRYLDAEAFTRQFLEPATTILGAHLKAIIFEQEYQRKQERRSSKELAKDLDDFFGRIPGDARYHVELRTESYLTENVFDVLGKHGVGQVLSHWTWLPPLTRQWNKARRRVLNRAKENIIRLMTPLGIRYEDAYGAAQPFEKMVKEMFQPQMIEETVEIMRAMTERKTRVNVIINNRAGGNAPLIAQMIARRFLEAPD